MAKSKRDAARKKRLNQYKQKKQMSQQTNQPQAPEIRQTPVWRQNDIIEMTGQEWEEIYNFINGATGAFMAANQVMSRNIVKGTVKLRFEKLNKTTGQYEQLSPEEEKPYQDELQAAIKAAVEVQNKKVAEPKDEWPSQEGVPHLDALVGADGKPLTQEKLNDDTPLIIS